jgi:hypothetical protein
MEIERNPNFVPLELPQNSEKLLVNGLEIVSFPATMVSKHVVIDGTAIFDTGSPNTIFKAQNPHLFEAIKMHLRVDANALIGTDNMYRKNIRLDLEHGIYHEIKHVVQTVEVSPSVAEATDHITEAEILRRYSANPLPFVDVKIEDLTVKCLFDTGAQIGYLPGVVIRQLGLKEVRKMTDFNPIMGKWETGVFEANVVMDDVTMRLSFGVLPDRYDGRYFIVGNEVLKHAVLLMDLYHHSIALQPHSVAS